MLPDDILAHVQKKQPVALSAADAGKIIKIHAGQAPVITLEDKPGAGYRWQVKSSTPEAGAIKEATHNPSPGRVGGSTERTFSLDGATKLSAGDTFQVVLAFARGSTKPIKTLKFRFEVV